MNSALELVVERFAQDPEHWLKVKSVLEERILANEEDNKANRDLITLVDKLIQEREKETSKLN